MGADLSAYSAPCLQTFNELGFEVQPCGSNKAPVPRYSYVATLDPDQMGTLFIALARTGEGSANRVCRENAAHYFAVDHKQKFTAAPGVTGPAFPATVNDSIAGSVLPIKILCPQ